MNMYIYEMIRVLNCGSSPGFASVLKTLRNPLNFRSSIKYFTGLKGLEIDLSMKVLDFLLKKIKKY